MAGPASGRRCPRRPTYASTPAGVDRPPASAPRAASGGKRPCFWAGPPRVLGGRPPGPGERWPPGALLPAPHWLVLLAVAPADRRRRPAGAGARPQSAGGGRYLTPGWGRGLDARPGCGVTQGATARPARQHVLVRLARPERHAGGRHPWAWGPDPGGGGAVLAGALAGGLQFFLATWAGQRVLRRLRTQLFHHLHRLSGAITPGTRWGA